MTDDDPADLRGLTLTQPAIAELARVRRPSVSVWRKRHASGEQPFPAPVDPDEETLRFRADEVAAWIERTGKGSNPEFRADAAVVAALSGAANPVQELGALTALLALLPYASRPVTEMTPDDLVDLADEVDVHDRFAYRETVELGDRLPVVARHAAAVASAAYNPASAIERLLADRHRLDDPRLTGTVLRPPLLNLVADIIGALVPDGEELVVTDPWPGCGDLLTAVLGRVERVEPVLAHVPDAPDPLLRIARRRLAAHGWPATATSGDADAHLVTQVPPLDQPDLDPAEVLRRVEDAVLGLPPGRAAVVVGPAAALVEELRDPAAERIRDDLLRSGRLRTTVVLPAGLIVSRPRQKTAIWVLGTVLPGEDPDGKRLAVADLSEHAPAGDEFDRGVVEDLLTDVVAAQGPGRGADRHSFRFARFVGSGDAIVHGRSLLGAAVATPDLFHREPAQVEHEVHELMAHLTPPAARSALPTVREVPGGEPGGRYTIARLVGHGFLHRRSGHTLRAEDVVRVSVEGTVPVIGPAEVRGDAPVGGRRIDRIGFLSRSSSGRFTEPGDIVYVTGPRPAAVVDTDGFSVVESPARIFRIPAHVRGRVVADVIAADINAVDAEAKDPESWTVRLVPVGQGAPLADALAGLRREERALDERRAMLSDLRARLTDGVAAGLVGLGPLGSGPAGQDEADRDMPDVSDSREDVRGR